MKYKITLIIATVVILTVGGITSEAWAAEEKKPRAARSVHLGYKAPEGRYFYNEVTVEKSYEGSQRYQTAAGPLSQRLGKNH